MRSSRRIPRPSESIELDRRYYGLREKLRDLREQRRKIEVKLLHHLDKEDRLERLIDETELKILKVKPVRKGKRRVAPSVIKGSFPPEIKSYRPVIPSHDEVKNREGAALILKSAQYNLAEFECLTDELPPRDAAVLRLSTPTEVLRHWTDPIGPNFEVLKYATAAT